MGEVGESMLQPRTIAGFPGAQTDERRGMLPRAQRVVNGEEGVRVPAPGSRDKEPALAKGIVPGDAGLLGVGNTPAVEPAG
jgi:hypothetical protein